MRDKELKSIIKIYFLIEKVSIVDVEIILCIDHCCQITLRMKGVCALGGARCGQKDWDGCAGQVPRGPLSLRGDAPSPSPDSLCISFCLQMKRPQKLQTADSDPTFH